jgi:hypothetical protein
MLSLMAVFSKFCTVAIWVVVVFHPYLRTRTVLFWVIAQREVVISYWYFGTIYRSHLLCGGSLKSRISKNVCNLTVHDTSCGQLIILLEVRAKWKFCSATVFFLIFSKNITWKKVYYLACAGSSIENWTQTYSKQWPYISWYNMCYI